MTNRIDVPARVYSVRLRMNRVFFSLTLTSATLPWKTIFRVEKTWKGMSSLKPGILLGMDWEGVSWGF